MVDLVSSNEARGVVLILDTLKKFTDLMQKREATDFGIISRSFVSAGGTLICLAHTNKHKSPEGKSVYSGTSDIRDDSDCAYIIDKIEGKMFGDEVAVEFVKDKSRGDVVDRISFSYRKHPGQSYAELLDTVKRIDSQKLSQMKEVAKVNQQAKDDSEIIDAVRDAIKGGVKSKSAIIKKVADETGISHSKIRRVMAARTGTLYSSGHRWIFNKGAHNKQEYELVSPTIMTL